MGGSRQCENDSRCYNKSHSVRDRTTAARTLPIYAEQVAIKYIEIAFEGIRAEGKHENN